VPRARGAIAHDATELRQQFGPYPVEPGQQDLIERHPEQRWPVLQAYVPDALAHLYSVSGVLEGDGPALATSLCQKTAQWPPTLGVGTVFHSCADDGLLAQGTRLAQRLLGRGLFELELIVDPAGQALAVDLNPRAFGQISLNLARGHDLPLLWYRQSCGLPVAPAAAPRDGVRWRHALPFHVDQGLQLWHAPARLSQLDRYLAELRAPHVDIVHDLGDPLPGLWFTAKMLRHPRALIRSLRRR
jgi:predicted ATP-grasp superfamily ATP-dependent carboligase